MCPSNKKLKYHKRFIFITGAFCNDIAGLKLLRKTQLPCDISAGTFSGRSISPAAAVRASPKTKKAPVHVGTGASRQGGVALPDYTGQPFSRKM
jgi:hypothetical protein